LKFVVFIFVVVAIFAAFGIIGTFFYLWANVISVGTAGAVSLTAIIWILLKSTGYVIIFGTIGFLCSIGALVTSDLLLEDSNDKK
jgi:hypothetical protein